MPSRKKVRDEKICSENVIYSGPPQTERDVFNVEIPADYDDTNWVNQRNIDYVTFQIKLIENGWQGMTPIHFNTDRKMHYIYDNNLVAGKFKTVYHGTSAAFHASVLKKGLDSGQSYEMNPGIMARQDIGVCCTSSYAIANSFAKATHRNLTDKINEIDRAGIDVEKGVNTAIIYRWEHDDELLFGESVPSGRALNVNELEFSLDGENWYPADKFKVELGKGDFKIMPNYVHPQIAKREAELIEQKSSSFAKRFSLFRSKHKKSHESHEDATAAPLCQHSCRL